MVRHNFHIIQLAIERFGAPASILSDNGSCFVGQNGRKKAASKGGTGMGTWQPTLFEEELLTRDIILINTGPCHPQTNGKLECFIAPSRRRYGIMTA